MEQCKRIIGVSTSFVSYLCLARIVVNKWSIVRKCSSPKLGEVTSPASVEGVSYELLACIVA
jgi:hypothetical protein